MSIRIHKQNIQNRTLTSRETRSPRQNTEEKVCGTSTLEGRREYQQSSSRESVHDTAEQSHQPLFHIHYDAEDPSHHSAYTKTLRFGATIPRYDPAILHQEGKFKNIHSIASHNDKVGNYRTGRALMQTQRNSIQEKPRKPWWHEQMHIVA